MPVSIDLLGDDEMAAAAPLVIFGGAATRVVRRASTVGPASDWVCVLCRCPGLVVPAIAALPGSIGVFILRPGRRHVETMVEPAHKLVEVRLQVANKVSRPLKRGPFP